MERDKAEAQPTGGMGPWKGYKSRETIIMTSLRNDAKGGMSNLLNDSEGKTHEILTIYG